MDQRITWDPIDNYNISHLTMHSDRIWKPELVISNPADTIYVFGENPTSVRYSNDGLAFWRPGLVTKTLCDIQTPAYPFDVHACYIGVIVWGAIPSEIIIGTPLNSVVTSVYARNPEWSLTDSSALSFTSGQMAGVTFGIQFSRNSAFLVINIVIPIVFLDLLNPVVFLLPHESGERVTFSVTILLSFTVFLNVIGDNVPKTSSPMPLLCHYVVIVLVTSGIITVLNTLSQRLYHVSGQKPVPKWLQEAFCLAAACSRNKTNHVTDKDEKMVTDDKCDVAQDSPVIWKQALIRIDVFSFTVFFIFALALAIGYLISMTTFQSGRLI